MRLLSIVFLVAVVARLAGQVVLGAFVQPETWEYEEIANNLLAGQGYTYVKDGATYVASQSSPLYILLTAAVYALTAHSQAAMLVLQAVVGGATAALCAWLAMRVHSVRAGWLAGGLVALDPSLIVYASKLHSLTLDALSFVAMICAAVALPMRPSLAQLSLLGLLIGLSGLTRATSLVLLPLVAAWLALFRATRLQPLAVVVGVAVLVYAPWPVRNSLLLGEFVPGSSEATEWQWRGTNPLATGSSWTTDGRVMLNPEFQMRIERASEAERMGIYRAATFDFIRAQPVQATALFVRKLGMFWWPLIGTTGSEYPPSWLLLYTVWYVPIVGLAAWGAWWGLRDAAARPIVILILASCAIVSISQALFYVEGRHRIAIEPLLLVLAGAGLATLVPGSLTRRLSMPNRPT